MGSLFAIPSRFPRHTPPVDTYPPSHYKAGYQAFPSHRISTPYRWPCSEANWGLFADNVRA